MRAVPPFNFGPASPHERTVFGACDPLLSGGLRAWIEFMRSQQIGRVVCLLEHPASHLDAYEDAFGRENVLHERVVDYTPPSATQLAAIIAFLREADERGERVVVHCGGGIGRTGVVLARWLVAARAFPLDEAVEAVRGSGAHRDPYESAAMGGVTRAMIDALIAGS